MARAVTTAQTDGPFENEVARSLQRQPHLFMRLMQNSLTVADSLRDNYFKNTTKFVSHLKQRMRIADGEPILVCNRADELEWSDLQGEVVTFIDGGVGQVQISSQVPLLLRVGSYSVRTGERRLTEREQFGYYPIVLGDLQGGSKERKDFIDIVRITAELLGGLSALARTPEMRVLMFHGPLVYLVGSYAGHTPFTEQDIDLFLHQYSHDAKQGQQLKEQFLKEAELDIYPRMTGGSDEWVKRRLFEPLSWMAFLFRRLIAEAKSRNPPVLLAGVVERGTLTDFSRSILLDRIFRGLRKKGNIDYFNTMYGRTDLNSPKSLLDKLGYTDALLLAIVVADRASHGGLGDGQVFWFARRKSHFAQRVGSYRCRLFSSKVRSVWFSKSQWLLRSCLGNDRTDPCRNVRQPWAESDWRMRISGLSLCPVVARLWLSGRLGYRGQIRTHPRVDDFGLCKTDSASLRDESAKRGN